MTVEEVRAYEIGTCPGAEYEAAADAVGTTCVARKMERMEVLLITAGRADAPMSLEQAIVSWWYFRKDIWDEVTTVSRW